MVTMESEKVLKQGADGRLIWTIPMDTIFERTFKTARAMPEQPNLEETLKLIQRSILQKYPVLQPHLGREQCMSRYNWFRRHFPQEYAFRILNQPDRQAQAVHDVIDSDKRRRLDAIDALFPTVQVNDRLDQISNRLQVIEDRMALLVTSTGAIEKALPEEEMQSETIVSQLSLLLTEFGVPEHKILRVIERAKEKTAEAVRAKAQADKPVVRIIRLPELVTADSPATSGTTPKARKVRRAKQA